MGITHGQPSSSSPISGPGWDGAHVVGVIEATEQESSPSTPEAGTSLIYPKVDGRWYTKGPDGEEISLGGGGVLPFDNVTLDATYGDDFDGPSLDAKWTPFGVTAGQAGEQFINSLLVPVGALVANSGYTEDVTDADEIDVWMAVMNPSYQGDASGAGVAILSSAGTGIGLNFRATSRLGIHSITTYGGANEPASNLGSVPGSALFGNGRKTWQRLRKCKFVGTDVYWQYWSANGYYWDMVPAGVGGYVPSAFTPAKVGWHTGNVYSSGYWPYGVDWINVKRYTYSANRLRFPTSGTVTATTNAGIEVGGSAAGAINGSDGDDFYFINSNASGTYWNAAFSVPQTINRVLLRLRGAGVDNWGSGYVEVSDGTVKRYPFGQGYGYMVMDIDQITTDYIKIVWLKGPTSTAYGQRPGLREVEAYLAS